MINTINQETENKAKLEILNNLTLNKPFNLENIAFILRTPNINLPGIFIEMNDLTCSILEYSREELLDMTLCDLIDEDCIKVLENKQIDLLQDEFVQYEITLNRKFGGKVKLVVDSFIFQSKNNIIEFAVAKIE